MKSYKKIIKVDLVNQLFICTAINNKDTKYYIEFKDLQNKDLILNCIKNLDKHYIKMVSDSIDSTYQSNVTIIKCSDVYKKKNKNPKPNKNIIDLCDKFKIKLNYNVNVWLNQQKDLNILNKFISRKAIIDLDKKNIYQKSKGALLLSSRLTVLSRKEHNLKIKIDNMVSLYNLDMLKKYDII